MITPKRVIETTPLVVARIEQRERAQRSRERPSAAGRAEHRPQIRDQRHPTRLVPAP